MLTATDFQTTGARVDFASALKDLGPPSSTQVNIRPCPSVEFNDISRIKAVLERAGYTRIGFGSPEKTRCK